MILTDEKRKELYYYNIPYFGAVIKNGEINCAMRAPERNWQQHFEFTHYILFDFLKTLPHEKTRQHKINNLLNE